MIWLRLFHFFTFTFESPMLKFAYKPNSLVNCLRHASESSHPRERSSPAFVYGAPAPTADGIAVPGANISFVKRS